MGRSPRTGPEHGQVRNEQENGCDDGNEQGSQRGGGTGCVRARESRNGWAGQEEQGPGNSDIRMKSLAQRGPGARAAGAPARDRGPTAKGRAGYDLQDRVISVYELG